MKVPSPDEVDLVLAHGRCFDGFTAQWCAWTRLGDKAEYREVFHGEVPQDVAGRNVAILDFAYRREALQVMAGEAASIVVLDHHKTAQADLEGLPFARFDMERSGARLAWDFFCADHYGPMGLFQKGSAPHIVHYVEDRDLWRFALPNSRQVSEALKIVPFEFGPWLEFAQELDSEFDHVVDRGLTLQALARQHLTLLAEHAAIATLDGVRVWVANSPYIYATDLGALLVNRGDGPKAAAIWRYDHAKRRMSFSLRSAEDGPDVSAIASHHGGGGHVHAAGFEVQTADPWTVLDQGRSR